jgi:hypothetical protein
MAARNAPSTAAAAGVARESASRTLTELKRRGFQSTSHYFINDKRTLLRETEDIV